MTYEGPIPEFPLPEASDREIEVWESSWRLPQGNAWALPAEAWRVRSVAMWVRVAVRCEDPCVGATVIAQLHRFADQVGLTTAGLSEMGWRVATDEIAARVVEHSDTPAVRHERRLRVAGDAQ